MNRIHKRSIWCESLFLAPPYMSEQYRHMHALNLLQELISINLMVRGIQFACTETFNMSWTPAILVRVELIRRLGLAQVCLSRKKGCDRAAIYLSFVVWGIQSTFLVY